MEKNVKILLKTINDYGDYKDVNENTYLGQYSIVNGKVYCVYEDDCKNIIRVQEDMVRITRKKSDFNSDLSFIKGESTISNYSLGGLLINMEIVTNKLQVDIDMEHAAVYIEYVIYIDGNVASTNVVQIEVTLTEVL